MAYVIWNLFLIVMIVRAGYQNGDSSNGGINGGAESNIGYAFTFLILGVIFGGIGNLIIAAVALVGLILAVCNRNNPNRKRRTFTYIGLIVLPIVTELLIILGGLYIPKLLL